jgi:hypothetical protein
VFEAALARLEKRTTKDLYHSALAVRVPDGEFVIEMAWPIPDDKGILRGVVAEGAVGSRRARSLRILRYEIRRWRDGVIPDLDEAVESPQRLTDDPLLAQRILELVPEVPTPVWGRDELRTGEMWNSNSLISWLIVRSGVGVDAVHPPGRRPGSGLARRDRNGTPRGASCGGCSTEIRSFAPSGSAPTLIADATMRGSDRRPKGVAMSSVHARTFPDDRSDRPTLVHPAPTEVRHNQWRWLAAGLTLVFLIPLVLTDLASINRDLYYGVFIGGVFAFVAAWLRLGVESPLALLVRNWRSGVASGSSSPL